MSEEKTYEEAPAIFAQATQRPIGEPEEPAYPGNINVGGGFFEGHYPGNYAKVFDDGSLETELNLFFADKHGCLVTGVFPLTNRVLVLYTRLVSKEEAEGLQKFSAEVKEKIAAEQQVKAQIAAEEARRAAEAHKELLRLADVGRNYEQNIKKPKTAK